MWFVRVGKSANSELGVHMMKIVARDRTWDIHGESRLVRQTNDGVSFQRSNASLVGTQGGEMRRYFSKKLAVLTSSSRLTLPIVHSLCAPQQIRVHVRNTYVRDEYMDRECREDVPRVEKLDETSAQIPRARAKIRDRYSPTRSWDYRVHVRTPLRGIKRFDEFYLFRKWKS